MGRWALAGVVVATVLAACGGSGGSSGSGDRAAPSGPRGACERGDDENLFDRYVVLMDPESGPQEILDVLQFGDDADVIDYVTTYVASSQLYDNFFSFYFAAGGSPVGDPTFRLDSVEVVDDTALFLIFTVEQEVTAGPASAQTVGRLLCVEGRWRVAINDVCVRMLESAMECTPELETLRRVGFEPFERVDIPEVVPESVPTTVPPPPETTIPPPPPDGICPYEGQPCSANVTNDPDCVCQPNPGPGFSGRGPGTLTCRGARA